MKKTKVNLEVNGKKYCLTVFPTKTLLQVLREDLQLTGTKEGCSEGECGACVVIMNGVAVNSCLVLIGQADKANITTIEGLEVDGKLHPLQEAFIEVGAVQCGFCTPGMIMSSKALLDTKPIPSVDEARTAISGNLCRCTGYTKIIEAIRLASAKLSQDSDS